MRVAVGSENPVKLAAAETVFEAVAGATVESVPVDAGVAEQPIGHGETIRGARNRARRALASGTYDLGVGIEAGVAGVSAGSAGDPGAPEVDTASGQTGLDCADGLFVVMWAAVADGNRVELGAGPSIRLPADVAARIQDGEELGPVVNDALDGENVGENAGAVGVLTGGLIDRERALEAAIAGALGPFVTDCY